MVAAARKHYIAEMLKPAERLHIVLKTYGNIAVKTRQEQTSATYNVLQELQGKYAPDVEALGLTGWVAELKARNDAYRELTDRRYDESTSKTDIVLRDARVELDSAYRAITKRIDALVEVEGAAAYEQFIRKHNEIVRKNSPKKKAAKKGAGEEDGEEGEE